MVDPNSGGATKSFDLVEIVRNLPGVLEVQEFLGAGAFSRVYSCCVEDSCLKQPATSAAASPAAAPPQASRRAKRPSARRHPAVEACSPDPKADPAPTCKPMRPGGTWSAKWALWMK